MLSTKELRRLRDEKVFTELRKWPKLKKKPKAGPQKPPQEPGGTYVIESPAAEHDEQPEKK